MAVFYKIPRGTRASLNTLAGSSGLIVGQVYLITDESRLAVATSTSVFQALAKTTEASGTNTGDQTITLTGDITGTGTGSFAATLATVNTNTGSFGTATAVSAVTLNGKGLVTACTATNIAVRLSGGYSNVSTANQIFPIGIAPRALTIASANCSAYAMTAATASYTVTLKKRTTGGSDTTLGTFIWASAGTVATVSITSSSVGSGDLVYLSCAATPDATLAGVGFLVSE